MYLTGGRITVRRFSQEVRNLVPGHSELYSLVGLWLDDVGTEAIDLAGADDGEDQDSTKDHGGSPRYTAGSADHSGHEQAGNDYNDSQTEKYWG